MDMRTLTLVKGREKYIIHYDPGSEHDVLDEIARLAQDRQAEFDWLDAAAMSFQVVHNTAEDCARTLRPTCP